MPQLSLSDGRYIHAAFDPELNGYVICGPNQIGTISYVPGRAPLNQPRAVASIDKDAKNARRDASAASPVQILPKPSADEQ